MFHNIFSKKEIKKAYKPKVEIIADIHEKDSMILAELKHNPDIELTIQQLKVGDYLIGDIIIERKTTNDFISSLVSKRLIDQLNQMQQYQKRILIIEGKQEDLYSKINPNSIKGFILSIITNHETSIIQTINYKDTSDYLIILAKQQMKPESKTSLHSRIPKTIKGQKQYILQAFPNIGPKKAELLLEKFKTLSNIFSASDEELKDILKSNTKSFKEIINS
jgi:ERCC4-type nuclease